jgi:polar amino acid transport system substrate-binding protein
MRRAVNGFLARFRAAGGFERLGNRWLAEEKAEFARLGFPFLF